MAQKIKLKVNKIWKFAWWKNKFVEVCGNHISYKYLVYNASCVSSVGLTEHFNQHDSMRGW